MMTRLALIASLSVACDRPAPSASGDVVLLAEECAADPLIPTIFEEREQAGCRRCLPLAARSVCGAAIRSCADGVHPPEGAARCRRALCADAPTLCELGRQLDPSLQATIESWLLGRHLHDLWDTEPAPTWLLDYLLFVFSKPGPFVDRLAEGALVLETTYLDPEQLAIHRATTMLQKRLAGGAVTLDGRGPPKPPGPLREHQEQAGGMP